MRGSGQQSQGDSVGAAWEVGTEQHPPSAALASSTGFVLPMQISTGPAPLVKTAILASAKTRKHTQGGQSFAAGSNDDPWAQGQDPWSLYRAAPSEKPRHTAEAATKIQEVHKQLQQEVATAVKALLAEQSQAGTDTEARFQKLESSVAELQAHGRKFENWFSEASKRMEQQSLEVGAIKQAVGAQQQDIAQLPGQVASQGEMVQNTVNQAVVTMRSDLNSQLTTQLSAQMEQIQALLKSKHRANSREGRSRS